MVLLLRSERDQSIVDANDGFREQGLEPSRAAHCAQAREVDSNVLSFKCPPGR